MAARHALCVMWVRNSPGNSIPAPRGKRRRTGWLMNCSVKGLRHYQAPGRAGAMAFPGFRAGRSGDGNGRAEATGRRLAQKLGYNRR